MPSNSDRLPGSEDMIMLRAGRTTDDDLFLRELNEGDWQTIITIKLSPLGKLLLQRLWKSGNQPINVSEAGYSGRYASIALINSRLRRCGETGYYLKRTDNRCWPETSLQLYVRKTR